MLYFSNKDVLYIFHFCTEKNTKKAIFEIYDAKIIFYIFSRHKKNVDIYASLSSSK